jgi:hypothetical protein
MREPAWTARRAWAAWMLRLTLLGLLLAAAAAGAQQPFGRGPRNDPGNGLADAPAGAWDSSAIAAADFETRLYWLADSLRLAYHAGPCDLGTRAPYQLPPRTAANALAVVFADGRRARWDPLLAIEGELYWPMERACSALGATLLWAPGRFSGKLLVDTLALRFAVGSEIIHCGDEARQMPAPVRYERNRLLLPVGFLERVVRPLLGDRFLVPAESLALVQRPLGPVCDGPRVADARGRTTLTWTLASEPDARLRTDRVGLLAIDLPGAYVDPARRLGAPGAGDARLCSVRPYGGGAEFLFAVDARILGWDTEWRESKREFRVLLTPFAEDLTRGSTYRRWPAVAAGGGRPAAPRRVLLVMPTAEATSELSGPLAQEAEDVIEFACALGDRVRDRLRELDLETEVIDMGRRPGMTEWAARANAKGGLACVILRPDICGDELGAGMRVVTAASEPGERPLADLAQAALEFKEPLSGGDTGGPVSLRAWEQVVPQHAAASEDLGWLMTEHLQFAWRESGNPPGGGGGSASGSSGVVWQRWPTGMLEGIDMPAALLYVGSDAAGRLDSLEAEPARIDALALALALALETFATRYEEGGRW